MTKSESARTLALALTLTLTLDVRDDVMGASEGSLRASDPAHTCSDIILDPSSRGMQYERRICCPWKGSWGVAHTCNSARVCRICVSLIHLLCLFVFLMWCSYCGLLFHCAFVCVFFYVILFYMSVVYVWCLHYCIWPFYGQYGVIINDVVTCIVGYCTLV